MKTSAAFKTCIILLFFMLNSATFAQQINTWTSKTAGQWLKKAAWSNGLNIKPHPSINSVEFAKQYNANKKWWNEAFIFMRDKNLQTLPPGKYAIDSDNVFATVTYGAPKAFDQSAWESHRKYIDLHYVITGKEKIGVSPLTKAKVTKPYDETRDGANYEAAGKYFIATPAEFFLFFPEDVHRPGIKADGCDTVKKLVIKIRMTE
jgi:YhcH/YjgK/YiaL family protein